MYKIILGIRVVALLFHLRGACSRAYNSERRGLKDDSFGTRFFRVGQSAPRLFAAEQRNESSMVRTKSREVDINK